MPIDQPIPKDLKQQLVQSIESFDEPELVFVHRVLLEVEKRRLWKKIGANAESEFKAGAWEDLDEVIRKVRTGSQET